jgi:hypothetical protein
MVSTGFSQMTVRTVEVQELLPAIDSTRGEGMESGRNRKVGAIAVAVVALVGVGTALAASRIHSGSSSNQAAGLRGGFGAGPSRANGFGPPGATNGGLRGLGGPGDSLSAAATYLGIDTSRLFSDLQSGQTLAQIAKSTSGKSVDGLVAAIVAAEKARLAAAVDAGQITQAQADAMSASETARVTSLVNGGFRGGFGGDGRPQAPSGQGSQSGRIPGTTL